MYLTTLPSKSKITTVLLALAIFCHSVDAAKKCTVDTDCSSENWADVCVNKKCEHKPAFPVHPIEIGGIFALMLAKVITTMAGIGGSQIVTPICIVLFGFITKESIPAVTFATFASTITSFIANWRVKHPEKSHAVLYDYGIISIMMPLTLAGAQIGSFLLVLMPGLIITIAITLILTLLCV